MKQSLIEAYKKLDTIKEFECDMNISKVLEVLNKWNTKAKDNDELQKVIEAFLEIQWHIIELKRDRDLALKGLVQYKLQRNQAIDERNETLTKIKKYENQYINGHNRRRKG